MIPIPFIITLLVLGFITSLVGNVLQALHRNRQDAKSEAVDELMCGMAAPKRAQRARKILRRVR